MVDANIRISAAARDRLAAIAAANGMSLRGYLVQLADTTLTPAERTAQAAEVKRILFEWNGYDPTPEESAELRAELDRRLKEAGAR